MTLGEKIKVLRKNKNLTQADLAKMCGYRSLTTINKIELGINQVPISTVEKLATALDVTPAYLMGWEEVMEDKRIDDGHRELVALIEQLTDEEVAELSNFVDYIISKRK